MSLKELIKTVVEIASMLACVILVFLGIPDYTRADWGILAAIAIVITVKR